MNQPLEFEQSAQRTFDEIKRSCQSLLSRTRALAQMTEGADPLNQQYNRARSALHFLEYAMDSLVPRGGIKLDFDPSQRASVLQCVDHLIDGLADPAGGARMRYREGPKPGLQGTTAAIDVPELLSFLGAHQKTGILEVVGLAETVMLGLQRGEIVHATSDCTPSGLRLGEILVAQGAIDERALFGALGKSSLPGRGSGKLGEILEREAGVSREKLRGALEYQVQQLFQRLHALKEGSFAFYEREPGSMDTLLRLNVNRLLLEAASRVDHGAVEVPASEDASLGAVEVTASEDARHGAVEAPVCEDESRAA